MKRLAITFLFSIISFCSVASDDYGDWVYDPGEVVRFETREIFGKPSIAFALFVDRAQQKPTSTIAFSIPVGDHGCDTEKKHPKRYVYINDQKAKAEVGCFNHNLLGLVLDDGFESFLAIKRVKEAEENENYLISLKKSLDDKRPLYFSSKGLTKVLNKIVLDGA